VSVAPRRADSPGLAAGCVGGRDDYRRPLARRVAGVADRVSASAALSDIGTATRGGAALVAIVAAFDSRAARLRATVPRVADDAFR